MPTLSEYFLELVKRKDVSYERISEETGISNGTLSYIGMGKTEQPKSGTLKKLSDYFGNNPSEKMEIYNSFMRLAGHYDLPPQLREVEIVRRLRRDYPEIYHEIVGDGELGLD